MIEMTVAEAVERLTGMAESLERVAVGRVAEGDNREAADIRMDVAALAAVLGALQAPGTGRRGASA